MDLLYSFNTWQVPVNPVLHTMAPWHKQQYKQQLQSPSFSGEHCKDIQYTQDNHVVSLMEVESPKKELLYSWILDTPWYIHVTNMYKFTYLRNFT